MPREAIIIHAAFEALCARYGVRPPAFLEELTPGVSRVQIDPADDPEAAARGAAMSYDEAVDYVTGVIQEILARAD
jgi:hypothetical protein